ncbi:MAG: ABC transporter ATP-binding protein [Chloroflexi bacterium]|nr:ABC transporter ATP-binding protein [Chloroflexota bacterium]
MTTIIEVKNLSKQFRRLHPDRPTTLIETIARGWRRLRSPDQFWALRDVSFSVKQGTMLGVLGHNGAGKSTLLRLLGAVGKVTSGSVVANGRIGALLDLGTGFHPELTGRENIYVAGIIGGLTRAEVSERFDQIVAFAELEQFVESPLRTYSTGMQMRLAFAVAIHIEPDILLIDEVLAVGDIAFQHKCLDKIAQFKAQGCTIVLVTHDVGKVQELCDDALWLRNGEVAAYGKSALVAGQYTAAMMAEATKDDPPLQPDLPSIENTDLQISENRYGSLKMQLTRVQLLDEVGEQVSQMASGRPLRIHIQHNAPTPIPYPNFSVTITREDGFVCYDTNTEVAGIEFAELQGNGELTLILDRVDLIAGEYFVDVGVFEQTWAYAYDYHWHAYPLMITDTGNDEGIIHPPHRWQVGERVETAVLSKTLS